MMRLINSLHCHRCRLWGKPGDVPPIIEKCPCFHHLLQPFPQYFGFPPNKMFDKCTPVYTVFAQWHAALMFCRLWHIQSVEVHLYFNVLHVK